MVAIYGFSPQEPADQAVCHFSDRMTSRMARRWHDVRVQRRAGFFLAAVALVVLAGCGSGSESNSVPTGKQPPVASGPFAEYDRNARSLVTREARWQAPETLTVARTERIGLAIGDGPDITNRINNLLEGTKTTSAGPLQVGSVVRATLRANPADAEITPSDAVNLSTGSNIQMLWTWLIHPKRPTDSLKLTAFLEVPLDNGHIISHEIGFTVPVKRTLVYTAEEVATHWGTWSAVAATLISFIGWLIRRRKRRRRAGTPDDPPPIEPAPAQQLAA